MYNSSFVQKQNKLSLNIYSDIVSDLIKEVSTEIAHTLMGEEDREQNRRNMAVRPSDFLPQKFYGREHDDPRSHVLCFDDYIKAQDLTDENTIVQRFKSTLAGHARSWIETKTFDPNTWENTKTNFVKYFTGSHSTLSSTLQLKEVKLEAGESMGRYLSRLLTVGKESYPWATKEALNGFLYSQFLDGLPEKLRLELAKSGLETLEEMVTKGQLVSTLDKSLLDRDTHKGVSFSTQEASNNLKYDRLAEAVDQIQLNMEKQSKPEQNTHKFRDYSRDSYRKRIDSSRDRYDRRDSSRGRYESRDRYHRDRSSSSYGRGQRSESGGRRHYNDQRRYNAGRDSSRNHREYSRDRYERRDSRDRKDFNRSRRDYSTDRRDRSRGRQDRSQSRGRNDRSQSRGRSSKDKEIKCYRCGNLGHIATYCKNF